MKIRRHLRSVRATVLSEDERRQELRAAEARIAAESGDPVESEVPPSQATAGRSDHTGRRR